MKIAAIQNEQETTGNPFFFLHVRVKTPLIGAVQPLQRTSEQKKNNAFITFHKNRKYDFYFGKHSGYIVCMKYPGLKKKIYRLFFTSVSFDGLKLRSLEGIV